MINETTFTWESQVRGYELDLQGIVNNAIYLNYFDHTRILHMRKLGLNWDDWHQKGFNFVLAHSDIHFKSSLRPHDYFYILSKVDVAGKIKMIFTQDIYHKTTGKLVAHAVNTIVCVAVSTGRPVALKDVDERFAPSA